MGTPTFHAENSAKRFGGKPEDYIEIHELIDSSKEAVSDLRHRVLTHNSWFITKILERIFGATIKNSSGKRISVRNIGQWHVMEDFGGSYPTVQDYVVGIKFENWMDNGLNDSVPPSHVGLPKFDKSKLVPKSSPVKKLKIKAKLLDEDFASRPCAGAGRID